MDVVLAEKRMFLGGRMAQLDTVYPTGEKAWDLLGPLIQDVVHHPSITVHTGATMCEASGVVGDFRIKFRMRPRGVMPGVDNIADAIAACPVEADYAFNYGLNKRKAIYAPYREAMWPQEGCIVWDDCTQCGDCVKAVGGKGIDLTPTADDIEVQAGVVVLATGYHPYEPADGEYGWGQPGVVTLQQLNRMMNPEGPTGGKVEVNGKPVKRVAFIHCVGACEHAGVHADKKRGKVNDYCARTCCTATMHAALQLQERDPELQTASFHQHIRTYGRGHEHYYDRASEAGMLFLRYPGMEPPQVVNDAQDGLLVRSKDLLTDGIEVEYPADLVVLSTGVVPRNHGDLRELFKCTIGADNFLSEVHPKLRPVEIAVAGIMVAGACQAPMDITEAAAGASAAASKAAAMISQGAIKMDPFVATVDESLCSGCQTCLTVCPYDAITRVEEDGIARVDDALCTGCGTCHAACPSAAIQQYGFTDDQVMAEVKMLLDSKLADLTA
jgi:heterodisulfide reductase subunit A